MADSQVVLGGADGLAGDGVADLGEEVEVPERVARLALGDRAEQRGDVRVALDVGLLGEVEVAAVRLALAGERLLEVLVGLGALEVSHALCSPWWLVWMSADGVAQAAQRPRKTISVAVTSKPWPGPAGTAHAGAVGVHVVDRAAARRTRGGGAASRFGSKRVEPVPRSSALELAHGGQVVERLVHGAQRDGRHLGAAPSA